MKEIKRKMLLTALVIVFAFVATAGTTYAWFQISPTVEAESLNFNMQAKDSLLIRVFNGEDPDNTYYLFEEDIYNFYQELKYERTSIFYKEPVEEEPEVDYYIYSTDDLELIPVFDGEDTIYDNRSKLEYRLYSDDPGVLVGVYYGGKAENPVVEPITDTIIIIESGNLFDTFEDANIALGKLFTPSSYFNYVSLEDIIEVEKYKDYLTWNLDPVTSIQPEHLIYPDHPWFPAVLNNTKKYAYTSVNAGNLNLLNNNYLRTLTPISPTDINQPFVDDNNFGKVIQLKFWVYSQASETRNLRLENLSFTSNNEAHPGYNPYVEEQFMDDFIDAIRLAIQSGVYEEEVTYLPVGFDPDNDDPTYAFDPPLDLVTINQKFANPTYIFGRNIDYDFAFARGLYGYKSLYDRLTPNDQRNYYEWETVGDMDSIKMTVLYEKVPDPESPGKLILKEIVEYQIEDPEKPGEFIDVYLTGAESPTGFNRISDLELMEYGLNTLEIGDDDLYEVDTATGLLLSDSSHGIMYGEDNSTVISQISPYRPQLVTVTIYIEGWDKDCNFNIVASHLKIDFSLTIKDEE